MMNKLIKSTRYIFGHNALIYGANNANLRGKVHNAWYSTKKKHLMVSKHRLHCLLSDIKD